MPRYNIRTENPVRYAQVKAEQDRLRAECARSSSITLARLCPYCDHKIEILSPWDPRLFVYQMPLIAERMLDSLLSLSAEHKHLPKIK